MIIGLEFGHIREVKNLILSISIPNYVPNDSIDPSCSIRNEYDRVNRGVENLCCCSSRLVEELRILIADEGIGLGFTCLLVSLLFLADNTGNTAKGA